MEKDLNEKYNKKSFLKSNCLFSIVEEKKWEASQSKAGFP